MDGEKWFLMLGIVVVIIFYSWVGVEIKERYDEERAVKDGRAEYYFDKYCIRRWRLLLKNKEKE